MLSRLTALLLSSACKQLTDTPLPLLSFPGCVYKLAVDRKYSAYNMEALLCGKPIDSAWAGQGWQGVGWAESNTAGTRAAMLCTWKDGK